MVSRQISCTLHGYEFIGCVWVSSNTVPIFIFAYYHETKVSFRFLQHNNESMFFSTSKILDVGLPISYKFG